jgi:thermolysin
MQRLIPFALAVIAVAGCSASTDTSTAAGGLDARDATPEQVRAFEKLEGSTQSSWTWVQHETLQTPMHLSSSRDAMPVLVNGEDPARTTLSLLAAHRELFKMHDPALELSMKTTRVDELGMTHARFQQTTHGIPVAGRELLAHYDKAGRITSIDADYVPGLENLDVQPALSADEARARVHLSILATSVTKSGDALEESAIQTNDGKLVVYAPDGAATAKLAYEYTSRVLASQTPAIWVTTVDAKSGEVLHAYNNLQTVTGQGTGVLGDQKTFDVTQTTNGFTMLDNSSGVEIRTFTAKKQEVTPGAMISSTSATAWDTGVTGAGAGVDAHFNAGVVFKYYKDHHSRNAIDGAGGTMLSTVHFGQAYDNAAWDGEGMLYGDGGSIFRALSAAVDVVGHEFTHGVTEKTSALAYEGQSGALNEAVSDIFGAYIEHSVLPDATKNWIMGEAILLGGGAIRDMRNPGAVSDPQPAHMKQFVNTQQDNGGVHTNSGIVNNAAYLMTVGGVNPVSKVEVKFGIGWDKSEKLWYRANTTYFKTTTNFGQAAQGVLQAAKDLAFTDNETNIVDCAFKATGIAQGTCATLVDPQAKAATEGAATTGDVADTTGGASPSKKATAAASDGTEDPGAAASKPTTHRRAVTTTESACNAGAAGRPGDARFLLLFGAALALAARRRISRTRP